MSRSPRLLVMLALFPAFAWHPNAARPDDPQENEVLVDSALVKAPDDWECLSIGRGNWRIEGDEVVQDSDSRGLPGVLLLFGDPIWADYDLTAQVKKAEGGEGFGLCFRVADANNFFTFCPGNYKNDFHEVHSISPEKWSRKVPLVPGRVAADQWSTLRVEARGDHFKCFLDGSEIFDFTDSANPKGRVGLRTWAKEVRFRQIKLTDPDGKSLWEGFPKLPTGATD